MPEFGSPFSGLANDRKLTDEELVRAIRFMVAAEYEAIQLYMQLTESTDNSLAIDIHAVDNKLHQLVLSIRILFQVLPVSGELFKDVCCPLQVIIGDGSELLELLLVLVAVQ